MSYDPKSYWGGRGRKYIPGTSKFLLGLGEAVFKRAVKRFNLSSILEVGSGNGRLYNAVKGALGDKTYEMCDFVESFL